MEKSSIRHACWHYGIINDRMRRFGEKQAQMQLLGGGSNAESTEGAGTSASGDDKLVVWTLSNDLIDFGERFGRADRSCR